MAARGLTGGLPVAVPLAVHVFAATGHPTVIVETVGTGQGGVDLTAFADTTTLVLAPGLGDDLQAAKAGSLEVADVLVVNKADLPGADTTRQSALAVRSFKRSGAGRLDPTVTAHGGDHRWRRPRRR
jgi:LAO/AO transport system kinase